MYVLFDCVICFVRLQGLVLLNSFSALYLFFKIIWQFFVYFNFCNNRLIVLGCWLFLASGSAFERFTAFHFLLFWRLFSCIDVIAVFLICLDSHIVESPEASLDFIILRPFLKNSHHTFALLFNKLHFFLFYFTNTFYQLGCSSSKLTQYNQYG